MLPNEELLERVRAALASRDDIVEKRMVSGRSFVVGGHLCCGVSGDALMVRVGPANREAALAEPHVRPMTMGGRQLAGFVLVDRPGHEDDAQLKAWIERAVDFASHL